MYLTPTNLVCLALFLWLAWKLVKPYVAPTSLEQIAGPKAASLFIGDLGRLLDRHKGLAFHQSLGQDFGPVVRLRGLLGANMLYVTDPLAIQQILSPEHEAYGFSTITRSLAALVIGPSLVTVEGKQHRRQRKALNPAFSTGSMKAFLPVFHGVSKKLRCIIAESAQQGGGEVDVLHWLSRAGVEFIAQAGLGHAFGEVDSRESPSHPIVNAVKQLMGTADRLIVFWLVAPYLMGFGSARFRRWLVATAVWLFPGQAPRKMLQIADTFHSTANTIYLEQVAALNSNTADLKMSSEHDLNMMQLLLRTNGQSDEQDKLSKDELTAQMSLLLFAGTETSSGLLGRILQQLALHPDVQNKLRSELTEARDFLDQDLDYDKLMSLPYLDGICRETLRLFPGVSINSRVAHKDNVLRFQKPVLGHDGTILHEVHVPKGTVVWIGNYLCGLSREVWGNDALEWKPERWLSPLPDAVAAASFPGVYSNLMSFGGGERSCIGFRFALLEIKVVLFVLVEAFRFSLTSREIYWNWASVDYPTMDKDTTEPSLVLKVDPVNN